MKVKVISKLVSFVLIQAFVMLNMSGLGNDVAYTYSENTNTLSPAIQLNTNLLQKTFQIHAKTKINPSKDNSVNNDNNSTMQVQLIMPDKKEIKRVREFIKQEFKEHNIVSIYLHGSARWSKSPADWDVLIFTQNPKHPSFRRGKSEEQKIDRWSVNLTALRNMEAKEAKELFDGKMSSLMLNTDMLGIVIYGKDILGDILKEFGIKTQNNYFRAAVYMIELSYRTTDIIEHAIELALKQNQSIETILPEIEERHFLAQAGKSLAGAALLVRKAIDTYALDYEFYTIRQIFDLWHEANAKKVSREDVITLRQVVKDAINDLNGRQAENKNLNPFSTTPALSGQIMDILPQTLIIEQAI